MSVLPRSMIEKAMSAGFVVIAPYREDQQKTSSYAVTLGQYYFLTREDGTWNGPLQSDPQSAVISIPPGHIALCHTHEFIGARSPYSALFTSFTADSGAIWLDTDDIRRLPIRIHNPHRQLNMILKVGVGIGAVSFFRNRQKVYENPSIEKTQQLNQQIANWNPVRNLLPDSFELSSHHHEVVDDHQYVPYDDLWMGGQQQHQEEGNIDPRPVP